MGTTFLLQFLEYFGFKLTHFSFLLQINKPVKLKKKKEKKEEESHNTLLKPLSFSWYHVKTTWNMKLEIFLGWLKDYVYTRSALPGKEWWCIILAKDSAVDATVAAELSVKLVWGIEPRALLTDLHLGEVLQQF